MLKMYHEKKAPPAPKKGKKSKKERVSRFDVGGNKIYFISLGCPRNLVDTEVMLGILLKAGYEPAEQLQDADFIVVNTCGFLEASRTESLDTIGQCLDGRKSSAKVIVTGCMVQTHSGEIKEEHPDVDYFLGSGDVEGILKAVESDEQGSEVTSARSYLESGEVPRQLSTPQHYAYLKIAEGCRKRCSYCIIPDIKGPLKSKTVGQILREFQTLLDQGVKEIILIAQDLGDWGRDLGFKGCEGLVYLLKEILKIPGDYWLRLLYLYPDEITDDLIEVIKNDSRICPYLDMPIQHINNELLKSMRRATNRDQIIGTITKLRKSIPDITIRTSLIVGFPGETEEQFEELAQFLQDHPLDNVGIFPYSKEAGSHSATLPGHLDAEVKQARYDRLMQIQQKIVEELNRKKVGTTLDAVVEGYHPETELLMRARFKGQCPEIDGQILINDGRNVTAFGERYQVEITDVAGYDLVGRVL